MPDVLTHLLVGASLALFIRLNGPKSDQMLIVLGAVLIDIERPLTWVITNTPFYWIGIGPAFHSILGAIVLSYFAAVCFEFETTAIRERFKFILIGCTSHLILDLVMYRWGELGLQLLYPLRIQFSFHLLWPDFLWYPLFGITALLITLSIRYLLLHYISEINDKSA